MLTLPIKKQWYDMIVAGIKKEEYREICPYYAVRFRMNGRCQATSRKELKTYRLRAGYRQDSPTCEITCWIDVGRGIAEWGAVPGTEYYRLHIEDVREVA